MDNDKKWLETLLEVSQLVNSTLALDELLDLVLDILNRVVLYDTASIQLLTPEGLEIIAYRGLPAKTQALGHIFPLTEEYPSYHVWRDKVSKIEADLQQYHKHDLIRGWLGIPLIFRNEAIGVIAVGSQDVDYYDETDAQMATIFANQVAVAIRNARHFSETKHQLEMLAKVHQASHAMTSYLDINQILEEVTELALEVTGADHAELALVDELGGLSESVSAATSSWPQVPSLTKRARPDGKTQHILTTGQTLIVSQIQNPSEHNPDILKAGVVSYVGFPLKPKRKVVGVLLVHSLQPGKFTKDRLTTLNTLANQTTIAIENAQLYNKIFDLDQIILALLDIERDVAQNMTAQSKEILDKISRSACKIVGADYAIICPYLADQGRYDLANVGTYGLKQDLTYQDKLRLTNEDSLAASVLKEERTLIYDLDLDQPGRSKEALIQREGFKALVGIRLNTADAVGVLFIGYRQPHHWSDNEIVLIDLFANQAATVILNARLFGQTNEQLAEKIIQLHSVNEINQSITSTLDLNAVLSLILSKAIELTKVTSVSLLLIENETDELILKLTQGDLMIPPDEARLKVGEGIAGKAAEEKRSIIVDDVTAEPWNVIYRAFLPNTRSELAVPLLYKQSCIGVLDFEHPEPRYFTINHLEIIEALAGQAAIAIKNARHYDELQSTKDDLAAIEAVAWIGMFGSSWAHSIIQKTSAARNYVNVLNNYVEPDSQAATLVNKVEEVMQTIQNIPIAHQLPSKASSTALVDLDTALQEQVQRWAKPYSQVELELDLKCSRIRTRIDREWLDIAMEKLISNALQAMPEGGQLKVASSFHNSHIEVVVSDTGSGISDKVRPFFLKGKVPKQYTSPSGSGIGILIARFIFRTFEGDLTLLYSDETRGTALQVTLPARPVTGEYIIVQ